MVSKLGDPFAEPLWYTNLSQRAELRDMSHSYWKKDINICNTNIRRK